jgi:hypothetical protein
MLIHEMPEHTGVKETDLIGDVIEISESLAKSAARAKRTGNFYLVITLVIGALILLLFVYSSEFAIQIEGIQLRFSEASEITQKTIGQLKDTLELINKASGTDQSLQKELISILSNRINPPEPASSPFSGVVNSVSGTVIRIGAVLIGIFLIQIMVGFARYYFKLAEHLRTCSMAIKLSAGRLSNLKVLVPLLMPSNIEFGKMPNSPIEKISEAAMKTIGEVSKKIPTR